MVVRPIGGGVTQAQLDAKVDILSPYAITGANTLDITNHYNRHGHWTGSSPVSQALTAGAEGVLVEVTNDGAARCTFTGITPKAGFKASVEPGETFEAVYSNGAWVSLTPIRQDTLPLTTISANYTTVLEDVGVYHSPGDATARSIVIDSHANVSYPTFKSLTFLNPNGAGALSISAFVDPMRLAGIGSTGSRNLAANGIAIAIWHGSEWIISGSGLT